jgi:hypothetical protein
MKYALIKSCGEYVIVNDDANFIIGVARSADGGKGPFRVLAYVVPHDRGGVEVATVKSLDECVTALADYYEKNPPRWVRKSAGWYKKETLYSSLRVEQDQRGHWRVYRDDYPLLEYGRPATFSKCAEAQRAADAHQLDDYPDAQTIDDGFHWLLDPEINWRSLPDVVEGRARWEILASLSRP